MNVRERFRAPKTVKLRDEDAGLTPLRENGDKDGRRTVRRTARVARSNASERSLPS
jgi:hypothetical protein